MKFLYSGLDVGSTTVKFVVFEEAVAMNNSDRNPEIIFSKYQKHNSDVTGTTISIINEFLDTNEHEFDRIKVAVTGSGGFQVADKLGIPYIQEVVACMSAVERILPETDVVIELGGEDAKVSYMGKEGSNVEVRMNGSCAGGTGAMIETLASLLKTDLNELNTLALEAKQLHPIASRCSVFAKTDVQALINENCDRADIAASVLQAVVNQTLGGLACGRPVRGNITFLGGPLYFLSSLRELFIKTIPELTHERAVCPENAQLFVAIGAAISDPTQFEHDSEDVAVRIAEGFSAEDLRNSIRDAMVNRVPETVRLEALFKDDEDYETFRDRHSQAIIPVIPIETSDYDGPLYVGIDAGSTTTKVVLMDDGKNIVWSHYGSNQGNPLESTRQALIKMYDAIPTSACSRIVRGAATGYGEELVKSALGIEDGIVETMAHLYAAAYFQPDVESVLDIGGQDMKFMKVHDGAVTSVVLNEACSAGCGSFLQTYASTVGLSLDEFTKMATMAQSPVDLGSRCTVFMNSRVKQMQKEGVSVADISAGICISVIKNCLYKTMRIRDVSDLGKHVVVQGGTFINDAVLRSFERLINVNVIRPAGHMAGLMGAYGACLHAQMKAKELATFNRMVSLANTTPERYRTTNSCAKQPANERNASDSSEDVGVPDIEDYNLHGSSTISPVGESENSESEENSQKGSKSAISIKNTASPRLKSSRASSSSLMIEANGELRQSNEEQKGSLEEDAKVFGTSLHEVLNHMPETTILSEDNLKSLTWETRSLRCKQCENQCLMTLSKFSDGTRHISGNRCERGAGVLAKKNVAIPDSVGSVENVPNTYLWKLERLFSDMKTSADVLKEERKGKKRFLGASSVSENDTNQTKDIEDVLVQEEVPEVQKPKKLSKKEKKVKTRSEVKIGIPRALNVWEDVIVWRTFFGKLGFTPVISSPTTKAMFQASLETIPSDTVCYPAKLVHGHVQTLLEAGIDHVWLPLIPRNRQKNKNLDDHFNCAIVSGYAEALESSMHELFEVAGATAHSPPLPMYDEKKLGQRLFEHFQNESSKTSIFGSITLKEVRSAVKAALHALDEYQLELQKKGEEALLFARKHGMRTIILAGRPYHADPGISHGVAKLLRTMGLVVVSEDSVFHLADDAATDRQNVLRIRNQWSYHHRLYASAHVAAALPFVEFVQLISFGCGLDAITADQCKDILVNQNALYTGLKIDEQSNLGVAKIRIRSLIAASEEREGICLPGFSKTEDGKEVAAAAAANSSRADEKAQLIREKVNKVESDLALGAAASAPEKKAAALQAEKNKKLNSKVEEEHFSQGSHDVLKEEVHSQDPAAVPGIEFFTKKMRDDGWTIVGPQMSPWHMRLYEAAANSRHDQFKVLHEVTQEDIDFGLKVVHNDSCYPATIVIGSLVRAVADPKRREELGIDINKVALIATSTGGQCRASNYIPLMRRALHTVGLGHIPCISISAQQFEKNTGFEINAELGVKMAYSTIFGDLCMRLALRIRPYEKNPGETMRVHDQVMTHAAKKLSTGKNPGSVMLPLFKKRHFRKIVRYAIDAFEKVEVVPGPHDKPRVLVIGEILVQYHSVANNHIIDYVIKNGAEPVLPDMMNFFLYCLFDEIVNVKLLSASWISSKVCKAAIWYVEKFKKIVNQELGANEERKKRFGQMSSIDDIFNCAKKLISPVCYAGEGWLIPGELCHYYEHDNLRAALILQPAFCLPNHIIGRGMQGRIRRILPGLATCAIDYDAGGLAEVNQQSRIKLLVSMALRDQKKRVSSTGESKESSEKCSNQKNEEIVVDLEGEVVEKE